MDCQQPPEKEGYEFVCWEQTELDNTIIYTPVYLAIEDGESSLIEENNNNGEENNTTLIINADTQNNNVEEQNNSENNAGMLSDKKNIIIYSISFVVFSFFIIFVIYSGIKKRFVKNGKRSDKKDNISNK